MLRIILLVALYVVATTPQVIDSEYLTPLRTLPSRALNSSATFNPIEATVASVHQAIFHNSVSCRDIVQSFLDRIAAFDQTGPTLNAVITTNPHALQAADELDANLTSATFTPGKLHCVPLLLKDNYDTFDMPTTAGSLSLKGAQPAQDAPVVKAMRDAGAIILGKANMHEFALTGLTISSILGQTKNPYDLTRTPGGSSGGTGASVAASFAVMGTGTDTVNSVRSPSSANALVGIRPSRGLVSRTGIVPVSTTQDALGPLARTVRDAAILLDVMASVGFDSADNVTALGVGQARDYLAHAEKGAASTMKGVRLGVLDVLINRTESDPEVFAVNKVFNATLATLARAGAIVTHVDDATFGIDHLSAVFDVQIYEFAHELDAYLAAQAGHVPTASRSLAGIVAQDTYEKQDTFTGMFLRNATVPANNETSPAYFQRRAGIDTLRSRLAMRFAEQGLDAIFYPHQSRLVVPIGSPSQIGRNGLVAGISGFPAIGVPGGFSEPSATAPIGVPVGVEFLGMPFGEGKLLEMAAAFERLTRARRSPMSTLEVKAYGEVFGKLMKSSILYTEHGDYSFRDTGIGVGTGSARQLRRRQVTSLQ